MDVIRSLTVSGDPFECGLAHGQACSMEIRENVETYFTRFEISGLKREDASAEGRKWLDAIAHQNPAYRAEMTGIARGAGIAEADIALLNARYEIAFTLFGKDAARQEELLSIGPDGCSTFGLLPETTVEGHTWLGQNWDWLEAIHGRALVLRVLARDLLLVGVVDVDLGLDVVGLRVDGDLERGVGLDRGQELFADLG